MSSNNMSPTGLTDLRSLEDQVVRLLAQILYVEPEAVDREAEFGSLGVDSILAVEFGSLLQQEFGIAIRAATIYEYPSPHDFAAYLATRLNS